NCTFDKYVGKKINDVLLSEKRVSEDQNFTITRSALVGSAHIKGPTGLKNYLDSGGVEKATDGNGVHCLSYAYNLSRSEANYSKESIQSLTN
ncbi:MAG: hypothetical protein ACRYE9_05535, partial [Janthinobacterium lividum]